MAGLSEVLPRSVPDPSSPRTRRRFVLQVGAVGLVWLAVLVAAHLVHQQVLHNWFDLRVYRGAVHWWAGGHPLYDYAYDHGPYGFTYPPFAVLALSPFALGGFTVGLVLISAVSLSVVGVATWRMFGPIARRAGWPPVFAVALVLPVVLLMEPVRETISFGQVNLLLVGLVLADVAAVRRGKWWAGVGIGLAAAIKLTPAVFVLYLVVTGRWRAAATAVGTALGVTALAALVMPGTSYTFWTGALWDTSRVGHTDKTTNQSLDGLLARVHGGGHAPQPLWALLAVVVLAVGLWRARRVQLQGDELTALTLVGLTANLISPISWTHHLFWLVPAVFVLVDLAVGRPAASRWDWLPVSGRRVRLGAGVAATVITVACCASVNWYFQTDDGLRHDGGLIGTVGENSYVLIMLALVALLPARARMGRPGGQPVPQPRVGGTWRRAKDSATST